jgi:hypothetical protein
MVLREGGRLYADFWSGGGEPDGTPLRPVAVGEVVATLRERGAHILHAVELDTNDPASSGRRTGRVVAEWVRTTD